MATYNTTTVTRSDGESWWDKVFHYLTPTGWVEQLGGELQGILMWFFFAALVVLGIMLIVRF